MGPSTKVSKVASDAYSQITAHDDGQPMGAAWRFLWAGLKGGS